MGEPAAAAFGLGGVTACALVVLATSCVSFELARSEFDSVAGLEDAETWPEEVVYRHDPLRYPWAVRAFDGIGLGSILRMVPSIERSPHELENPSGFARDSVESMIGDASNIHQVAEAARRLLWVAELDEEQPLNQAIAVKGITKLMARLEMNPVGMRLPDPSITTEAVMQEWEATLERGWPATRQGQNLPGAERAEYLAAIEGITALPYPSSAGQRALIGALNRFRDFEVDPELIEPTRRALDSALYHGLSMGLLRGLYSRSPRVRETAIHGLHELGGVDTVPFVLALIAKPSSVAARGINRYDEDRFVRLALVRMCGQLNSERALTTWGAGPAPAEFLYETLFADPDPGLREVALEALARSLGQPISFDRQWAERWWRDEYVPHRGARSEP